MDVLEFYNPPLDVKQFRRGQLSEDVWRALVDVVRLSHAVRHWSDAAASERRSRPPAPFYKESAHARRKRLREWEAGINQLETRRYRAAFLAGSRLWDIAGMVQEREGSADWNLSLALMKAVGVEYITNTISGHERAEFGALAFDAFDAASEVSDDPDAMAARWRTTVGLAA